MSKTLTTQDRTKQLAGLLNDVPHPARYLAASALRSARVRWLLDLADVIDALGLAETDELAGSARSAAFGLVRDAITNTASTAQS